VLVPAVLSAHDGPAFPIVTTRVIGPYEVSVWADPDVTKDQTAGAEFWVNVKTADGRAAPADTRARVSVAPADGVGPIQSGTTRPENGDAAKQIVALPIDREGRFRVAVEMSGSLGEAKVDAEVNATYGEPSSPGLSFVYLVPFALVAVLWINLWLRRRRRTT
jgi:hypothetical protein